jgi:WD40 repeat protein
MGKIVDPRRRPLAAMAIVSTLAVTAFQYIGHGSARPTAAQAQSPPPVIVQDTETGTIDTLWSGPTNGFRAASFAPDDSSFAVVGVGGSITLYRKKTDKVWKSVWNQAVAGATNALPSPGGKVVLAYAAMDPTRQSVTFIQEVDAYPVPLPKGKGVKRETSPNAKGAGVCEVSLCRFILDGSVWDAALSADGHSAAIVTGGHSLYLFHLDGTPTYRRVTIRGTGDSIAISQDGSFLASGTWDASGVSCYARDGSLLWRYPDDVDPSGSIVNRLFEAQIAKDSPYVLGLSYANVDQGNATVYLWRKSSASPRWIYALGPNDSDPQAMIAANGSYVAVAYVHRLMHGNKSAQEHLLVLLDRYGTAGFGHEVWPTPRGGLLMSPTLVAISPDGNTITVTDGQRKIYTYDSDGRISAPAKTMTALIHQTIASNDGRYVLVYTGDGQLTLVRPV